MTLSNFDFRPTVIIPNPQYHMHKQHQKKDYKERSDNVEKARALIQIQFESLVIEGENYQAEFIASGAMKFIMVAKERTKLIVSRLIANT